MFDDEVEIHACDRPMLDAMVADPFQRRKEPAGVGNDQSIILAMPPPGRADIAISPGGIENWTHDMVVPPNADGGNAG